MAVTVVVAVEVAMAVAVEVAVAVAAASAVAVAVEAAAAVDVNRFSVRMEAHVKMMAEASCFAVVLMIIQESTVKRYPAIIAVSIEVIGHLLV